MTRDYRILIGVDGSEGSDRAADFVGHLPVRPGDDVVVASHDVAPHRASAHAERAIARLAALGVTAQVANCRGEDAVDALIRAAESERAALVVVGSRGRGPWASILLGSTARSLAILSPTPVLIVREPVPVTRVLVADDGSASAHAALRAFARLPQNEATIVELLFVLFDHRWHDDEIDWHAIGNRTKIERAEESTARALLDRDERLLPRGLRGNARVERGHAGETILRRAAEIDADLVVVGTQGLHGPRQFFYGSTAERVLTQTRANVLVGRPAADT